MGISINTSFEVGAAVAIDSRLVLTKAEMLAANDNILPDVYLAVCKDDGKLYIYNKTNDLISTTGKYRLVDNGSSEEGDYLLQVTQLQTTSEWADRVVQYIGNTTANAVKGHIYYCQQSSYGEVTTVEGMIEYLGLYGNTVAVNKEGEDPIARKSILIGQDQYFVDFAGTGIKVVSNDTGNIFASVSDDEGTAVSDADVAALDYAWSAYTWMDVSPDNFQYPTMPTASSEFVGRVIQYIGVDTEDYRRGHFYECVSDGEPLPTYSWEDIATDNTSYDDIINRPLIKSGGTELYNDTITLGAGDETVVSDLDFVLTDGHKYKLQLNNGVAKEYTAASGEIDASEDGIVITSSSGTSTITVTNSAFSGDPLVVLSESIVVDVNPDYQEFFDNIPVKAEGMAAAALAKAEESEGAATLEEDVTANVAVGGVSIGDTLTEGSDVTELIKALLVKYYAPTISMASDKPLLNKKGTTIANPIEVTATSVKASKNITSTLLFNPSGTQVASGTNAAGETLTYSYDTDISTDTTFTSSVTDGKETVNASLKFEFINPYYYGNADSSSLSDFTGLTEQLVKKATSKDVTYTANNKFLVFAYDSSYGALTSIKDQNNFENLTSWTAGTLTVDGEVYRVYVTNTAVTCSNFKYTFKI